MKKFMKLTCAFLTLSLYSVSNSVIAQVNPTFNDPLDQYGSECFGGDQICQTSATDIWTLLSPLTNPNYQQFTNLTFPTMIDNEESRTDIVIEVCSRQAELDKASCESLFNKIDDYVEPVCGSSVSALTRNASISVPHALIVFTACQVLGNQGLGHLREDCLNKSGSDGFDCIMRNL